MKAFLGWFEDRTGLVSAFGAAVDRPLAGAPSLRYVLPSALVFGCLVEAITGLLDERPVMGSYKLTGTARTLTGGNYGGGGDNKEQRDVALLTGAATPEALAWTGWGTALKPSWEPFIIGRKP